MIVVFYISGHGFGHASRQVEVLHAFSRLRPEARIVLRTAASPALLARTLTIPCELRPGPCDTGIVQTSSIDHDDEATVREAVAFYEAFDDRIAAEVRAFGDARVGLIVGDIAPLAFEVAATLGVPGVAVANFTWDWIYETHPGLADTAPWLVPRLRAAYARATRALELPFGGGFDVFTDVTPMPLVARRPTRTRAETRAHFGIPPDRPAALLSFGGYGLPHLRLDSVDARAAGRWTLVTTDQSSGNRTPAGVVCIPEAAFLGSGFRYEDVVAAVDAVVTKPGYGIVAECIACRTPLVYTSRGDFREYDRIVRDLPRYARARYLAQPDLFAGRWLEALEAVRRAPPPPETMALDGAEEVARELTRVLDAST